MGLHFLPGSMKGTVRLFDDMVDDQVIDRQPVAIEVLDNPFRLFYPQGLGDGHDDVLCEALVPDKLSDVVGEGLPP